MLHTHTYTQPHAHDDDDNIYSHILCYVDGRAPNGCLTAPSCHMQYIQCILYIIIYVYVYSIYICIYNNIVDAVMFND